jgi:hypothetical protein
MTAPPYPATPYLRRMTRENGWHAQLVRDQQGRADRIVAVRVGPTFTDAVAIEAESCCVALRLRTYDDSPLILPGEDSATGAVWFRDGACAEVLAELFELQAERPL